MGGRNLDENDNDDNNDDAITRTRQKETLLSSMKVKVK